MRFAPGPINVPSEPVWIAARDVPPALRAALAQQLGAECRGRNARRFNRVPAGWVALAAVPVLAQAVVLALDPGLLARVRPWQLALAALAGAMLVAAAVARWARGFARPGGQAMVLGEFSVVLLEPGAVCVVPAEALEVQGEEVRLGAELFDDEARPAGWYDRVRALAERARMQAAAVDTDPWRALAASAKRVPAARARRGFRARLALGALAGAVLGAGGEGLLVPRAARAAGARAERAALAAQEAECRERIEGAGLNDVVSWLVSPARVDWGACESQVDLACRVSAGRVLAANQTRYLDAFLQSYACADQADLRARVTAARAQTRVADCATLWSGAQENTGEWAYNSLQEFLTRLECAGHAARADALRRATEVCEGWSARATAGTPDAGEALRLFRAYGFCGSAVEREAFSDQVCEGWRQRGSDAGDAGMSQMKEYLAWSFCGTRESRAQVSRELFGRCHQRYLHGRTVRDPDLRAVIALLSAACASLEWKFFYTGGEGVNDAAVDVIARGVARDLEEVKNILEAPGARANPFAQAAGGDAGAGGSGDAGAGGDAGAEGTTFEAERLDAPQSEGLWWFTRVEVLDAQGRPLPDSIEVQEASPQTLRAYRAHFALMTPWGEAVPEGDIRLDGIARYVRRP